jgi:hypothetical protein
VQHRTLTGYTRRMLRKHLEFAIPALLAATGVLAACSAAEDALTAHSRPAAEAVGHTLGTNELAWIIAESPLPDSAMRSDVAGQAARLWADYVTLATIYRQPDSTRSVDFTPLLDEGRYFASLAVERFRDSLVSLTADPTDAEVREYFDSRQPFTRLDIRRIAIRVPPEASEAMRDSLFDEASELRERLAGGSDFVEMARVHSDEPPEERGKILPFQGHETLPDVADSALFAMRPGQISPVFATSDAMLIYRLEQRRQPEFEEARELTYQRMVEERASASETRALDSLMSAAQRSIPEDAPEAAIRIASRPDMAEGSIAGSAPLARIVGGSLTAAELRTLFKVRPDLRQRFAVASEDEAYDLLMELATDEVLVQAAEASGYAVGEVERDRLQLALAEQLAAVGGRYNLSHMLVTDPSFDLDVASKNFVRAVLQAQKPVPWLAEFRFVLDPGYPSKIDEQGSESAAQLASDLRATGAAGAPEGTGDDPVEGTDEENPTEPVTAPAVGEQDG